MFRLDKSILNIFNSEFTELFRTVAINSTECTSKVENLTISNCQARTPLYFYKNESEIKNVSITRSNCSIDNGYLCDG